MLHSLAPSFPRERERERERERNRGGGLVTHKRRQHEGEIYPQTQAAFFVRPLKKKTAQICTGPLEAAFDVHFDDFFPPFSDCRLTYLSMNIRFCFGKKILFNCKPGVGGIRVLTDQFHSLCFAHKLPHTYKKKSKTKVGSTRVFADQLYSLCEV